MNLFSSLLSFPLNKPLLTESDLYKFESDVHRCMRNWNRSKKSFEFPRKLRIENRSSRSSTNEEKDRCGGFCNHWIVVFIWSFGVFPRSRRRISSRKWMSMAMRRVIRNDFGQTIRRPVPSRLLRLLLLRRVSPVRTVRTRVPARPISTSIITFIINISVLNVKNSFRVIFFSIFTWTKCIIRLCDMRPTVVWSKVVLKLSAISINVWRTCPRSIRRRIDKCTIFFISSPINKSIRTKRTNWSSVTKARKPFSIIDVYKHDLFLAHRIGIPKTNLNEFLLFFF